MKEEYTLISAKVFKNSKTIKHIINTNPSISTPLIKLNSLNIIEIRLNRVPIKWSSMTHPIKHSKENKQMSQRFKKKKKKIIKPHENMIINVHF